MKIDKQTHLPSRQLLLCFAGWSASPEIFRRLRVEAPEEGNANTDVWICYDYRDLSFPENIDSYETIRLVAWSLGVWVAEQLFAGRLAAYRPLLKSAVAVNGTGRPIDDRYGIPATIFQATLEYLTPEGIGRFIRRMCGNRTVLAAYARIPSRPSDEISEELHRLYEQIQSPVARETAAPTGLFPWTQAILSTDDRIFPFENLRRYWQSRCPIREIEAPHYPFYIWKQWNELWRQ